MTEHAFLRFTCDRCEHLCVAPSFAWLKSNPHRCASCSRPAKRLPPRKRILGFFTADQIEGAVALASAYRSEVFERANHGKRPVFFVPYPTEVEALVAAGWEPLRIVFGGAPALTAQGRRKFMKLIKGGKPE
jgi:hypothetical protein